MTLRIRFEKTGDMRFISHLDLMRLIRRGLRRTGFPVTVTRGFSPHIKLSMPKALKVGLESRDEEALCYFDRAIAPARLVEELNRQLPEGVRIVHAETV